MPAQHCNRIALAHEQLETAITLFLEHGSFASVITLAGAAERVMGQALRHAGKRAVLDWKADAADLVHAALHRKPLDRSAFAAAENRVSNALRHFDATDEEDFDADLDEAACWMLARACENAHRLGLEVRGFDTFNDWFLEHIVGV